VSTGPGAAPPAPRAVPAPRAPNAAGAALASLPRRLAALAYEALLVTALIFVLGFAMLPLVSPGASRAAGALALPALPARVGLFFVMFGVLAWYFSWSWSDGRATLAQKSWRLRVVAASGFASRRDALARYLAAWIGPAIAVAAYLALRPHGLGAHAAWLVALNFLFALVDRDRQFLHDRLARTRLVVADAAR
jgi:uncharacterized RDD family membrane protein YckC